MHRRIGAAPVAWLMLVAASLVAGCGEAAQDGATVGGSVSFNGQPVTSGLINFMAAEGRPVGGAIKPDGTYEFEIPPGEYRVRIDSPPALPAGWKEGDPPPKLGPRPVPEKYASFDSSGLTATIGGDSPQQVDFSLPK